MSPEIDVVVPFCHRDQPLAVLLLRWLHGFNRSPIRAECVLAPSGTCSQRMIYQVYVAALEVFDSVSVRVCDIQDAPWPVGPNRMFAWIAQSQRRPFLWLEPDCIPKREQWFDELCEAYAKAKKPIIADHYDETHTSGIAVYAPADARVLANIGNPAEAWDSREPELFRALSENTPLIQHFWGQKNLAPRFTPKGDGKPGEATLRLLHPAACLFHRCKDGSLMTLLRPQFDVGILSPKPELPARSAGPCIVELGRYGDIINILPVLRDLARSGRSPALAVSKEFSGILDGVSYAKPFVLDCGFADVAEARAQSQAVFNTVTVTQVWGKNWNAERKTAHFNQESWRLAGYLDRWNDPSLQLIFDRRNYQRERALIEAHLPKTPKPVVLLNLRGGFSSPFNDWEQCQKRIEEAYGGTFEFVDIGGIRAERIYDLLGLMELAAGMVTIDTASLHLAAATSLPVLALLSPHGGWLQSAPRCKIVDAFGCLEWNAKPSQFDAAMDAFQAASSGDVLHAFERHATKESRVKAAQTTWASTGWKQVPYEKYKRDARQIGDRRDLPFLRDVLDNALAHAKDRDAIVLTNDDNTLRSELDGIVRRMLNRSVMLTGRRTEYMAGKVVPGVMHYGRDIVAWKAGWLRQNFWSVPDFLLGAAEWDLWAAGECRRLAGVSTEDAARSLKEIVYEKNVRVEDSTVCEIPAGYVGHEVHQSVWTQNRFTPSELHNKRLLAAWRKHAHV